MSMLSIDGHNITKAEEFMSNIDGHKNAGNSVNLTLYRGAVAFSSTIHTSSNIIVQP
ncbi:MAG: hypothetical protein WA364_05925 [Candidatus Nitrosopolaris sp.]